MVHCDTLGHWYIGIYTKTHPYCKYTYVYAHVWVYVHVYVCMCEGFICTLKENISGNDLYDGHDKKAFWRA